MNALDKAKAKLTDRQRALLAEVRVEDNRAIFGGAVIPDWKALKSVLEALGGRWVKGGKARPGGFVFADDVDAEAMVSTARATGEILDPRKADFFPTPAPLADRVAARAGIAPGLSVLEPSAGRGALALAAIRAGASLLDVHCVELLPENVAALAALGFATVAADFLTVTPAVGLFDRVAMNPPFGKRADVAHVRHAFTFLKPGGRLVAIMSAGVTFRDDTIGSAFRAFIAINGGSIEELPAGSFREAGTMVGTVMVSLERSAA